MTRVLCAWEFGGDLGHIRRLSALARELRRAGCETPFALSDLAASPADDAIACYPAPILSLKARDDPGSLSASDLLLGLGFGDGAALTGPLRGWLSLLALVKPAVVVADFAPGALLAARIAGIPRVNLSSGYSSPVRGDPMPGFRAWQPVPEAMLLKADATLLAAVNKALASLGAPPLASAAQVFDADLDLTCTFAEIDPFGARAGREYFGPLDHGAGGEPCAWQSQARPRIFAYLKPRNPHFAALAAALAAVAGEAVLAAPGLDAAQAAALSKPNLRVVPGAVNLDGLLESCDLAIGHSGAGFTARCLAAGVPQGLLPLHLEQYLIARRVAEAGTGAIVRPDEPPPDFIEWMRGLAANRDMASAARTAGAPLAHHSGARASAQVAERVVALAAR